MPRHYTMSSVGEIVPSPTPLQPPAGDAPLSVREQQRQLVAASLLLCPERERPDTRAGQ